MNDRYTIIKEFVSHGQNMIIIKFDNSVHVMPVEEWKVFFGWLHPERWKNGKRVRRNNKIS